MLKAIVFDYGNTLVEFGPEQARYCDDALAEALEALYGPLDRAQLRAIRAADRMAPYRNAFRENDLTEITTRLVHRLFGRAPSREELARLLAVRHESLVECIDVEAEALEIVERLSTRYAIGVLSNYPSGETLRASLERTGIAERVQAVIVSADIGYVKPDPRPFEEVLKVLGVEPAEAMMIGDNWLADIQGAKRIGMCAAHVRRWASLEEFDVEEAHHPADLSIQRLRELEPALLT